MIRDKIIMFRVNILEKKQIEKKARTVKMNTADFCRSLALRKQIKKSLTDEELQIFSELHVYRNNFIRINNLLKEKDSNFAKEVMKTVKNIDKAILKFVNKNDRESQEH